MRDIVPCNIIITQLSYVFFLEDLYYYTSLYESKNDPSPYESKNDPSPSNNRTPPPQVTWRLIIKQNVHLNLYYNVVLCIIVKYNVIEQIKKLFRFFFVFTRNYLPWTWSFLYSYTQLLSPFCSKSLHIFISIFVWLSR